MKKFLCLVLALLLTMSIVAGCGEKDENKTTPTTSTEIEENKEETPLTEENKVDVAVETEQASNSEKKPSKSSNVTSDKNTAAEETDDTNLYVIKSGGTNEEQISYHLKSCPVLAGKEYEKIAWNAVRVIGLRHCSKCNPPKYDGYVE